MIGERLRQARLRAGLTQDQVAEILASLGITLTKAGLSKYEKGGSVPKPSVLMALARALGVRADYMLSESQVKVEWLAFRKHASLTKKQQERIQAMASEAAEKQVWLLERMLPNEKPEFPAPAKAQKAEDAEKAAGALRKFWKLGEQPIESITEAIENRGGLVVECSEKEGEFHGLSGWAGKYPLLVVSGAGTDDRRRFNLAHELGHLVMDTNGLPEKLQESLTHRFAAAFIVPPSMAIRELGAVRRHLSFPELSLLKQKSGLSMQAWMRRALDLDVIDQSQYNALCRQFSAYGWRKKEPVSFECMERPTRIRLLTLRALAEGIITPEKAESICPGAGIEGIEVKKQATKPLRMTALELMARPLTERKKVLAEAAAAVENDYANDPNLTAFDAFGEEDLNDDSM